MNTIRVIFDLCNRDLANDRNEDHAENRNEDLTGIVQMIVTKVVQRIVQMIVTKVVQKIRRQSSNVDSIFFVSLATTITLFNYIH